MDLGETYPLSRMHTYLPLVHVYEHTSDMHHRHPH
jgi:hypothetical protein